MAESEYDILAEQLAIVCLQMQQLLSGMEGVNVQRLIELQSDILHLTQRMGAVAAADRAAREVAEKNAHHLARFDILTELPNRLLFEETLKRELAQAARQNFTLALFLFDIDNFKSINDTFGHTVGDSVLKQFAARAKATMRAEDFIARLGGDEFIMVSTQRKDWDRVAERMLAALSGIYEGEGQRIEVTVSIGIATFPECNSVSTLLRQADRALYAAKEKGRNTYIHGD